MQTFKRKYIEAVMIIFTAVAFCSGCVNIDNEVEDGYSNPSVKNPAEPPSDTLSPDVVFFDQFLDRINSTPDSLNQVLVDSFIQTIQEDTLFGYPFIQDQVAVYLFQGGPYTNNLYVPGDHNGWDAYADRMVHIEGSNLYYLRKVYPADSRLDYKFIVNGNWILDPRNPRRVTGGYGPNSELVMPDYVDPEEIKYHPDIAHGTLQSFSFTSQIKNNTRMVRVYLPPEYSETEDPYPVLYVHDGSEYVNLAFMENVLDYCINRDIVNPLVCVFVDPVNRNSEYWFDRSLITMFVDELMPHIDTTYNISSNKDETGIMGTSLGGVTSFLFTHERSDVFGFAGCMSSALYINNYEMIDLIEANPLVDVDYYFDVGTFESLLNQNRTMRNALASKGYSFSYREYNDAHSWGNWRSHIDDLLRSFQKRIEKYED